MAMRFFDTLGRPFPFRLRSLGWDHLQEPIRRPHGFPHPQWLQVRSGRLRLEWAGQAAVVREGDGLFLAADEAHSYRSEGGPARVDWLGFDGAGVAAVLAEGPLAATGPRRLGPSDRLDAVWARARDLAADPAPSGPRQSALVYEFLMVLTEEASSGSQPSLAGGLGRLEPVLAALMLRPAQAWTADDLARLAGVSPQHLGRLFRRSLGEAPLEYLTTLRLNRARQLLVERPDLRVHEVGAAVGWDDPNYFGRLFRQREGRTPGQFRALQMGVEAPPVVRSRTGTTEGPGSSPP